MKNSVSRRQALHGATLASASADGMLGACASGAKRSACARNGLGPDSRAAVFLSEADRCNSTGAGWRAGRSPLSTAHEEPSLIWLKVNGQTKQNANLNQMIWSVAEQIGKLSEAFELRPGDIICSGTPENPGPVAKGDVIDCHIDGLPDLGIRIVQKPVGRV